MQVPGEPHGERQHGEEYQGAAQQGDVFELQQAVEAGVQTGQDRTECRSGPAAAMKRPTVDRCLRDHGRCADQIGRSEADLFAERQEEQIEDAEREPDQPVLHGMRAADGVAALDMASREKPSLIVLDIIMPELDGTSVCTQLRATSDVPIIFLSSRDDEMDRILGLELGGDDYVVKPFSPRELVARVKAMLRRHGQPAGGDSQRLVQGRLVIDLEAHVALWDGGEVALTATEFALLKVFVGQPRRAFTRDNLMAAAYPGSRFVSDRTIDSHVRHIRSKFGAVGGDPIETVHGVGYKLAAI